MIKKTLEFSTKIDTSDFDRAVADMQKKLRDVYRPADNAASQRATATRLEGMGLGGNLSKPAMDAYSKSINQTKVAMDKFIADQAKGLQESAKLIAKQEDGMKKLRTTQQSMNKDSKEYLELQKQIQAQEMNLSKQREQVAGRYQAINQAMDTRQGMESGGGGFGSNWKGGWKGAAQRGAAVTGTIAGAAEIAERLAGYGQRLEAARGSAVQGTVGQDLSRAYGGKSAFEQMYMPERGAAEGLSKQKEDRNRIIDSVKGIAGASMIGIGAGLSMTGAGALVGVPMMAGGAAMLTNDRSRKALMGGGKEYEQLLAGERAKDFRSTLEDLKSQDPAKKLTLDRYEQNYRQELDSQRMLGMSDQQFRGGTGFQARGHAAGFMSDQMDRMAQGIIGAGGSARMGGQAQFGLQMERAGMTNASGILGSLSNSIQSPESTKRATIGIMAEAFQQGLDNTDFAEENRRFTQSVANVIGRSGATSEADQDRISKMFGQFLGQRTNQGVEAATSAYESFQQRGSQTSGRRGAIRMSEAINDPDLGNLETTEINELLSARPDQLKTTSPMVMAYAKKANLTPEELLNKLQGGRDKARFLVPGRKAKADEYSKDINDYLKSSGMTYAEFAEKASRGGNELIGDDAKKAVNSFGMLQGLVSMENKQGMNDAELAAQTGEMVTGRNPTNAAEARDRVQQELDKRDRMGDKIEAAGATGEDVARRNLNLMSEDLKKAADAASGFAEVVSRQAQRMSVDAEANRAKLPQGSGMNMDIMSRFNAKPEPNMSVQPQGGVNK